MEKNARQKTVFLEQCNFFAIARLLYPAAAYSWMAWYNCTLVSLYSVKLSTMHGVFFTIFFIIFRGYGDFLTAVVWYFDIDWDNRVYRISDSL